MGNGVSSSRRNSSERIYCLYCREFSEACTCPNSVGSCGCPPGAAPSPSCVFYSPRIQALRDGQRTEEQTTIDHWTGVDAESEAVGEENLKYFDEVLVKHPEWGRFFTRFEDLEVGAKIGEGGQAEIFAATSHSFIHRYWGRPELVAKVWKEGISLRDLERQWPPQLLSKFVKRVGENWPFATTYGGGKGVDADWPFKTIYGGAFIRDGEFKNRFAFVMRRRWGDLRTLIDRRMLELLDRNLHGPPFHNIKDVYRVLSHILVDLRGLHDAGIVHRDIKASNVLIGDVSANFLSFVIDFECSVGITGTGFWRAPEILDQLQKGVPARKVIFTEKADIYSFGMLWYEMVTGCIPFEGHPSNDYSIVLIGDRPKLPCGLDPKLREVILDCWQHDPQHRPTMRDLRYNYAMFPYI